MSTKTEQSRRTPSSVGPGVGQLRKIAAPFVADPATAVCIRTRLKALTGEDEEVLRQVGTHLAVWPALILRHGCGPVWVTTRMAGPSANAT